MDIATVDTVIAQVAAYVPPVGKVQTVRAQPLDEDHDVPVRGIGAADTIRVHETTTLFTVQETTPAPGEVQLLSIPQAGDGSAFTLDVDGHITAPIAWDATRSAMATNIQDALEALPNVEAGGLHVVVTHNGETSIHANFDVTFSVAFDEAPMLIPAWSDPPAAAASPGSPACVPM